MNSVGLFGARAVRKLPINGILTRKLNLDGIYPYPNHYVNTFYHPQQELFRENWELVKPLDEAYQSFEKFPNIMTMFWCSCFLYFFNDPGTVFGHHEFPDPADWTDEELGIPPPEFGPYKEWLEKKTQGK